MNTYLMRKPADLSKAVPHARAQRPHKWMSGTLRSWLRSGQRRRKQRKMIAALEAMDDRLLLDIGIPRAQIRQVVESLDDRELNMRPVASSAVRSNGWDPQELAA